MSGERELVEGREGLAEKLEPIQVGIEKWNLARLGGLRSQDKERVNS